MYLFRTQSGSIYQVDNGRITRMGSGPILGLPDPTQVDRQPFTMPHGPPTVGRRFSFVPKGWTQPITTSVVEAITRDDDPEVIDAFLGHPASGVVEFPYTGDEAREDERRREHYGPTGAFWANGPANPFDRFGKAA